MDSYRIRHRLLLNGVDGTDGLRLRGPPLVRFLAQPQLHTQGTEGRHGPEQTLALDHTISFITYRNAVERLRRGIERGIMRLS